MHAYSSSFSLFLSFPHPTTLLQPFPSSSSLSSSSNGNAAMLILGLPSFSPNLNSTRAAQAPHAAAARRRRRSLDFGKHEQQAPDPKIFQLSLSLCHELPTAAKGFLVSHLKRGGGGGEWGRRRVFKQIQIFPPPPLFSSTTFGLPLCC